MFYSQLCFLTLHLIKQVDDRYRRCVVDDIADLLWKISQICGGRYRRSVPAVEVFSNNSVADITIENNYFLNQALMGC